MASPPPPKSPPHLDDVGLLLFVFVEGLAPLVPMLDGLLIVIGIVATRQRPPASLIPLVIVAGLIPHVLDVVSGSADPPTVAIGDGRT